MLFLLDANVLIDANRDYYSIDRVPEFWDWLEYKGNGGEVKIPIEMYEEIAEGNDNLGNWTKRPDIERAILLDEDVEESLVEKVIKEGYASDLTDVEVEKIGRDPFLIAYGLQDIEERRIVTTEVSKLTKIRANRHIPDVCDDFGLLAINTFEFIRALNFTTSWNS
ncbi:MAG: DUF4411 family protein [Candidatus Krumholzibacteriota bacterium]|nr:DUF4411 family protein [Candidatus Krumholzibacteriota bacterium]